MEHTSPGHDQLLSTAALLPWFYYCPVLGFQSLRFQFSAFSYLKCKCSSVHGSGLSKSRKSQAAYSIEFTRNTQGSWRGIPWRASLSSTLLSTDTMLSGLLRPDMYPEQHRFVHLCKLTLNKNPFLLLLL